MRGGVKPSSNATFHDRIRRFFESIQEHVIASKAKQSKETCHPELVWQSEQTKNEFCEPASRVAESPISLVKNKMLNIVDFIKSLFVKRFSMTYLTKTLAFTLAETLVVMGIIGVVAALTIPNLNQSTGDREKVAKVKKVYANLEDAFGRATAVYGPIEEWFQNDGDNKARIKRFAERMTEFMKVSKNCEFGEGCFSNQDLLYSDGTVNIGNYLDDLISESSYMVTLADGTSLAFQKVYNDGAGIIRIDIDGPNKGKNQQGNDIFEVVIEDGQMYPTWLTAMDGPEIYNVNGNFTYWVLQKDNLDYLKCPKELDWDTKTSCK